MSLHGYKRILLLTGSPGVGKTTVLLKVVEMLRSRDFRLGGIVSREVRSCGERVGFEIVDLACGKSGWLAHTSLAHGPTVGRYRVNLDDLDRIGSSAIQNAVEGSDAVVIDEVGPMELLSQRFCSAVKVAADSGKLVVGVIHLKAKGALADYLKVRTDTEQFTTTVSNRDELPKIVVQKALQFLENQSR
jgi:nucleoside-triphosphatase